MHCEACVAKLEAALDAAPGLSAESVSIGTAVATVDPDSASSKDALDIVRECGFQVASFRNA